MAALKYVQGHLGKRIRVLQKACMSSVMENGITTMPNEILTLVFERGHRMTSGCAFAKCVSHVSRRFRQTSLRTTLLWSRLSAAYADTQIQTFLERSGQVDLEVSTRLPFGSAPEKIGVIS
ncbi:hypothetical protein BD410DRAFT_788754 [Rickenella mellea]|uniref:Uncharacterized protein n=1 Tax=Rickenella mellea TaxID=50990 RepID=A0A4Y7Q5N4_9AGAM|nr:hypothetical protein BD410DRAFT_788754 [Rickenella mellea]